MRIAFIGCVELSFALLGHLLESRPGEVVGVATRRTSSFHADFRSLQPLAERHGLDCLLVQGNDQQGLAAWLRRLAPDVAYCFGWSYLLHRELLAIPRLGMVGFHPAALPLNRGRHPLIWALALGLAETASTFFFMDEAADAGDLLDQRRVAILPQDDAGSLYARIIAVARQQVDGFTPQLAAGSYQRVPQDHRLATSWRRRTHADGCIDWRMPAAGIYNLVRALARPYVGAHFLRDGEEIKVWRAAPELARALPANCEPGKVLMVAGRELLVKCGDGAVWLREHELQEPPSPGSYLG